MSRLLALDQSSKITGYAFFDNGRLIDYGKFSYDDSNVDTRLVKIRSRVEGLIDSYFPDEVVFEDIQQQNNVANNIQTFKVLAEVYGVIAELLEELHIPHSTVLAATWKSKLGVKGKTRPEQKRNAQEYVSNTYGIKATQDECDAICIGASHLQQSKSAWD